MNSSPAPLVRPCGTVLLLLHELHLRGYQRLRALPCMSPSSAYWRCSIAPVTLVASEHGARIADEMWFDDPLVATYTSGQDAKYFGWTDSAHLTPS